MILQNNLYKQIKCTSADQ